MDTPSHRIGIMVCTAQRPQMLINCLKSLMAQIVPMSAVIEICVVENDTTPHSRDAVLDLASTSPFKIHYFQEPKRGIPFARNKTLEVALSHNYDWIALIDDDETAHPDWLKCHLEAVLQFDADVSYGLLKQTYEAPLPEWMPQSPPPKRKYGDFLGRASTGNVFFNQSLILPPSNLRFNKLLTYGYEDLDFFENAVASGFTIVWNPKAVIEEDIPASRVDPNRLIAFANSSAAAHAQVAIIRKGYWSAFPGFAAKGLRRILTALPMLALTYLPSKFGVKSAIKKYYKNRMRLSRGIGNLQGILLRPPSYYSTIDGR